MFSFFFPWILLFFLVESVFSFFFLKIFILWISTSFVLQHCYAYPFSYLSKTKFYSQKGNINPKLWTIFKSSCIYIYLLDCQSFHLLRTPSTQLIVNLFSGFQLAIRTKDVMAAMQTSGATERPWLNRSLATVREQVRCVSRIDRLADQLGQYDSLVIR